VPIYIAVCLRQPEALPCVESARYDICVLSLDLELAAVPHPRPCFNGAHKPSADTSPLRILRNPQIPNDSQVSPPLQHVDTRAVEGDHDSSNSRIPMKGAHDGPIRDIKESRPVQGIFERVIVLAVRVIKSPLTEFKPFCSFMHIEHESRFKATSHQDVAPQFA